MSKTTRIDELLSRYEAARKQGQRLTPEELCRSCPELLEEVRREIQVLGELGALLTPSRSEQTPVSPDKGAAGAEDAEWWPTPSGGFSLLAPPQAPDEIGRLGPYRLLKVLGEGGMGIVYQAEDPELQRPVALKVMKPALAAVPRARQRFLREARAAAALKSDRIVTIYHVGEDRGIPFLVMEFLEGEPLNRRLERGAPLPVAEVLHLGRELTEGLDTAHQRGLIHRDVKPSNVWLEALPGAPAAAGPGYRVKILDFGLARTVGPSAQLTDPGAVLGTPAYMAPEQARGEAVDGRCDLFSLGCVLYQACTGEAPFRGANTVSILANVLTQHPRPPLELNPGLPPALSELVMRLLAKDPADRPPTAAAVLQALQAIEAGGSVTASAPPRQREPVPTASLPPPRGRQRRTLWAAVVLLGVLGLAVVATWWLRRGVAGPAVLPPLEGSLDVLISEENNPRRQNLRLNDNGALPLKPKDQFRIEAEVTRPAYLYVLWIDPDGTVQPVYPWKPGHWQVRPAVEQPVSGLRRPEALDEFYEVSQGTPGMLTLVLLARETPLPPAVDLKAALGALPPQTEQDIRATVWFENGAVVRDEPGRSATCFDPKRSNDPVLQTQQRLRTKLQPYFTYTRAVSFANQGQ